MFNGALTNGLTWKEIARTNNADETINVSSMNNYKEVMITLHKNNGRVCGSTVSPFAVFKNGAMYCNGISSVSATITHYGVCVYLSDTQIEIAGTYNQARVFAR